jgi:nucleotide-binding universal stress UspA family protein
VLVVPERLAREHDWEPPLRMTVAVDLSPATDAALAWVKELAALAACRIELVHAYWPLRQTQRLGLPWPEPGSDNELEIQEVLDRELRARVERFWGSCQVPLHLRPALGPEFETLAAEAEREEADLLVVGTSQGRLGSVGVATLHAARVPVLCVPSRLGATAAQRPDLAAPRTLLVPTDLSALANAAVPYACRLLGASGGKVVVCYASATPDRDRRLEDLEHLRHELLALVPAEAGRLGIRAGTFVQESGPPATAIVQAAQRLGCDGIVMSSHARTGLSHALAGSVAEAVMRESPVPVTVVPARAAEAMI